MFTFERLRGSVAFVAIAAAFIPQTASADVVLTTDEAIIQNSLCIGFSCPASLTFGFDTFRLMEDNLRILFDDSSTTAGFPANDWRLIANDSQSGGANYLAIEDATAARQILRVDAGAPANSIRVSSTGRLGVGTAAPVLQVHVANSNTPGIRLDQNGSAGWTPQVWDVAGNEANFFVRDVTHGSRLSFRIRPGAPTSSLDIAANGNVGVGDASPDAQLDVVRTGSGAADVLRLENTGGNIVVQYDTNVIDWVQTIGGNFILREAGGPTALRLSTTGNLTIAGEITTSGSCSVGCDRVFSDDYDLPSIGEHASLMYEAGYLPAVGPTVEGTPMNVTRKVEGILNELEKAHIYIHQLEEAQRKRDEQIALLEDAQRQRDATLALLEERLSRIEAAD